MNIEAMKQQAREALELAEKATPGPWLHTVPENPEVTVYTFGAIIWGEAKPAEKEGWVSDGINIGEFAPTDDDYSDVGYKIDQNSNGIFVSASRTLVPDLARAVLELAIKVEVLQDQTRTGRFVERLNGKQE